MSMKARIRGFSLIEVLVALIVISIGMLGIAKIHSLAYNNTTTANLRSLAAIQASSLAAAMHGNRSFWALGTAPSNIVIATTPGASGTTTITATPANSSLTTTPAFTCVSYSSPCSDVQIAAIDLQNWALSLRVALPNAGAIINCPPVPTPVTCSIQVTYNEKWMTLDKSANAIEQTMGYQMFVEP